MPLALLERVICVNKVQLDTHVLGVLAERGIAFTVANPRKMQQRALLLGAGHNEVQWRLLHYRLAQDSMWRLTFSRDLVLAKVKGQLAWVEHLLHQRPDQRRTLLTARERLQALQPAIATVGQLDQLLGLEGAAARAGFMAWAAVLPASLGFTGRKRRPPPDPVNAVLSLSFTLLHARAVQVLHSHGLDPLLGFYHEPAFARESLASDLIEPWRPELEGWVWQQFSQQVLRSHHFKQDVSGCFLDKAGRQLYFAAIEWRLRTLTRALRLQTRALMKAMQAWQAPPVTNHIDT